MTSKDELIKDPRSDMRAHVVLLGAGASRATFPNGDANGKLLPVMSDFIDILNLKGFFKNNIFDPLSNFEEIYSNLISKSNKKLQQMLEYKIFAYFSSLKMPHTVNYYDRLLLSLREKDAIFTFNWDPFLYEAYIRNMGVASLPKIYFLHGCVSIGECEIHGHFGGNNDNCPECEMQFSKVPLLYPIKNKNYSQHASRYIKETWKEVEKEFREAYTITIFGYSAPTSDHDAKEFLKKAWYAESNRKMEYIEIIDIEKRDILAERWRSFAPTSHYSLINSFEESKLWKWPRRTCESLYYSQSEGAACQIFSTSQDDNLIQFQNYIRSIAQYENPL